MSWLDRILAARRTAPAEQPRLGGRYRIRVAGGRDFVMSAEEALRLAAIWACITVIAKAIGSCGWDVFAEDAAGNRKPRKDTATWARLNVEPNPETIAYRFREAQLIQAMVWGNSYAEVERTLGGAPAAIWLLDPERCKLIRDLADGRLKLEVRNAGGRADSVLDYDDVFHLAGPSCDGIAGYQPVVMALRTLAQMRAADVFQASLFENRYSFGHKIKSAANISADAKREIIEALDEEARGPANAGAIFFAEGGLDIEALQLNAEDGQFAELRAFLIEEACRWYGVPPHKVAHLKSATFSNMEQLAIEFVRDAVVPWCERLRQEADRKLLHGNARFLRSRIDTEWLSEGDAKTKSEVDASDFRSGLATANEIRRRRGRNTVGPEGDALLVQSQMVPLKQVAEGRAAPAAPPPDGDPVAPPMPANKLNGSGDIHVD